MVVVGGGMELRSLKVLKKPGHAVSYGRSANASGRFTMGPIAWGFARFFVAGIDTSSNAKQRGR